MKTHYAALLILLACALLPGVADAQAPQLEAAYVVLGPQGPVARAILADATACPAVTIDGTQRPMTVRAAPDATFPVLVCELLIPAGAASASPFLFENVSENKARAFALITGAGTIMGGAIAWFLTRDMSNETAKGRGSSFARNLTPLGGVIGTSATPNGPVPAYGVGLSGKF